MKTKDQLILEATCPSSLSRAQIGWLSRAQIGWLSPDQIGWLSPDQIGWLSRAQIGGLSPDQIGGLSPDQIGWLSRAQIGWLSPDQIGWLSPDQIGWLSREYPSIAKLLKKYEWKKPYTNLLAAINSPGCALKMKTWHTCETTHCIAGWTVTKAPMGKELEAEIGTGPAARLILMASRPGAPLPRFDSNAPEDAIMAFVEARAAEEI